MVDVQDSKGRVRADGGRVFDLDVLHMMEEGDCRGREWRCDYDGGVDGGCGSGYRSASVPCPCL